MTILWWHWLVLALLLLAAELAIAGGFYFIFFGLAAGVVGLLALAGLPGGASVQVFLFALLSVGALLLFRVRLLRWMQLDPQTPAIDVVVGEVGTAVEPLAPGDVGKVQLRGAFWSARNASDVNLTPGARCRVIGIEGLLLFVAPEGVRA